MLLWKLSEMMVEKCSIYCLLYSRHSSKQEVVDGHSRGDGTQQQSGRVDDPRETLSLGSLHLLVVLSLGQVAQPSRTLVSSPVKC